MKPDIRKIVLHHLQPGFGLGHEYELVFLVPRDVP
jgi:hypothetical protein